jgi:hypothetical protein
MRAYYYPTIQTAFMTMLTFSGAKALSSFRFDKLQQLIRDISPNLSLLSARYLHFASVSQALDTEEESTLSPVLENGASAQ